jgi:hypothetical protein
MTGPFTLTFSTTLPSPETSRLPFSLTSVSLLLRLASDLTFDTLRWPLAPVLVASGLAEHVGVGADAAVEETKPAPIRVMTAAETNL